MTNRTGSLLFLFVAALVATAVLLALGVSLLATRGGAEPWLAPVIAVLCQATALYYGRHYILPPVSARSAGRSAIIIAAMVVATLAIAMAVVALLQWTSGRALTPPIVTLVLWFGLLWVAVRQQHARAALGQSYH